MNKTNHSVTVPPRISSNWPLYLLGMVAMLSMTGHALWATEFLDFSLEELTAIPANSGRLIGDMFPPDVSVVPKMVPAIIETLQMSLVGTIFGVLFSVPLGFMAARNMSPHPLLYYGSRGIIGIARSVPDLVWAIYFVIIVGLGPLAGALTLFVDTIGFAGRFYAEAMEEVNPEPAEALRAIGATHSGLFFSATLPAALPSFINTSLYSLERAVQSSVVLGLVGAGGIGMMLEEPMTWHDYDQACTVVIVIFLMLLFVERISSTRRKRIIEGKR